MTAQLICKLCQVEPAEYIIGSVSTGDQMFVCEGDMVVWTLSWLQQRTSPETAAMLRDHFAAIASPPPDPHSPAQAPPSRRRGRHSPPAEGEGPAATPEPPPPAAQLG